MLVLLLRLSGVACIAAGLSHVVLGTGADTMLGAPAETLIDATRDSQNRFYGAAFMLYGLLAILGSYNLRQHQTVLRLMLGSLFIGGLARLISIWFYGPPSALALGLLVSELIIPPLFWIMLNRNVRPLS